MIKVKRYAPHEVGVNQSLIQKLDDETEEAKEHYKAELKKFKEDNTYKIKSFSFKQYGKTKPDLIKVFKSKCAYCETSILQGQPGDVEHFRPKSAVDARLVGIDNLSPKVQVPTKENSKIKPGYYWLAADWYNLLLSCNSCNRLSTQLNANKNSSDIIADETLTEETLGKGTRFPFVDVSLRIGDPDIKISEEKDIRLLIDPGEDDPVDHLTFVKHTGRKNNLIDTDDVEVEEKFGMIKALTDKGIASIQVFGLARLTLVQEREKAALQVMSDLTDLKQAVIGYVKSSKQLKSEPNNTFAKDIKESSIETVDRKMKSLTAHFKNSSKSTAPSQYLGMKRVILQNWLKEENTIVADLEKLGIDLERLLILELLNELNFIRQLAKEYNIADQASNDIEKNAKKEILKKVWKDLKAELKQGSDHLKSKKSLVKVWTSTIQRRESTTIDTLKTLGFDPDLI